MRVTIAYLLAERSGGIAKSELGAAPTAPKQAAEPAKPADGEGVATEDDAEDD